MPHALSRCDQCHEPDHPGDDHPKIHTPVESYHHDCAPRALVAQLPAESLAHQVITAARQGVRGDDLRAHIFALHGQEA